MSRLSPSVLVAVLAVMAVSMNRASADGAKGTAVVKGRVIFDGNPPAKLLPPINVHPFSFCATQNVKKKDADQATLIYDDQRHAIPYVFVYMKDGVKGKYDPPKEPAVIDQRDCIFHPHVMGVIAGQQLNIKNSDRTAHSIHALPTKNPKFNLAQPQPGVIELKDSEAFTKPEMAIKVKCDVHSWMSAWCHVMAHPFFDVTKDHMDYPIKDDKGAEIAGNKEKWGTFELKYLPAGDYTVEAWHETFGIVQAKVSVKEGETREIEIKMTAKTAEGQANPTQVILSSGVSSGKDASAMEACCAAKEIRADDVEPR